MITKEAIIQKVIAKIKKRPPKGWFDKMFKKVKENNPKYTEEQIKATVGNIWHNKLTDYKKKKIKKRYHK